MVAVKELVQVKDMAITGHTREKTRVERQWTTRLPPPSLKFTLTHHHVEAVMATGILKS
jgi:hypothetical protein